MVFGGPPLRRRCRVALASYVLAAVGCQDVTPPQPRTDAVVPSPPIGSVDAKPASPEASALVGSTYELPPADVVEIIDAKPSPDVLPSPSGKHLLVAQRDALPSIEILARPFERLAGIRIDPARNAARRTRFFSRLDVIDVQAGRCLQTSPPTIPSTNPPGVSRRRIPRRRSLRLRRRRRPPSRPRPRRRPPRRRAPGARRARPRRLLRPRRPHRPQRRHPRTAARACPRRRRATSRGPWRPCPAVMQPGRLSARRPPDGRLPLRRRAQPPRDAAPRPSRSSPRPTQRA